MTVSWDLTADEVSKGDDRRKINPTRDYVDNSGVTHYIFSKANFHNPKYIIPEDEFILFYNFLNGGSREYPSDGNIPVDVVAASASQVYNRIKEIAGNVNNKFHKNAKKLSRFELADLVRGTMKLYLGNYTTRDWRRKRSTDDLDFWISDIRLLEQILSELGYMKNRDTKEWEKKISWRDPWDGRKQQGTLIASNDLVQGLDFGAGSYLDGSSLKNILKKKIVRGHDVDLSDIINVAIVNKIPKTYDPSHPWATFIEAANMRQARVSSNLISLVRYSHGIADYLDRVGQSIETFKETVSKQKYISNKEIVQICKVSSHWMRAQPTDEVDKTRNRIYNNLIKQERRKKQYAYTLRDFAYNILDILNSKLKSSNILLEIDE